MKRIIAIVCLMAVCTLKEAMAQTMSDVAKSGLNEREFRKYWTVESESADYKVSFNGDTADIVAPKGLTLWRKEKMKRGQRIVVEYDACVVDNGNEGDRLSDLNCFWMATDNKHPDDIFKRASWRQGVFTRCYNLKTYYLGYGGNSNTTTRFRRYDGDERGIDDGQYRPAILKEYTDKDHLLKPNHWYHIRIVNEHNRVSYEIDGERLVDFRDASPLTEGWFGFRTTWSHTRITHFRVEQTKEETACVPLHWVGEQPETDKPVSFGVPFSKGEVKSGKELSFRFLSKDNKETLQGNADFWPLAYWPDGSVKWMGVATVVPAGAEGMSVVSSASHIEGKASAKGKRSSARTKGGKDALNEIRAEQRDGRICIQTGAIAAYLSTGGTNLVDSVVYGGRRVGEGLRLVASTQDKAEIPEDGQLTTKHYESRVEKAVVEHAGKERAVVRLEGHHAGDNRQWLPFIVRLYFYRGSKEMRMVHSFVFDGDDQKDFIRSMGISLGVPMRDEAYNRHVAFSCNDGGVWSEPVQPLDGRRELYAGDERPRRPRPDESLPAEQQAGQLSLQQQQMLGRRIPPREAFNEQNRALIDEWAQWDGYRLSQPSADGFTIRKKACADTPWIGTMGGQRSDGVAFVGDLSGGVTMAMKDFWQSCPSAIELEGCRTETATMTAWLWSPDAEPMDLRHYDHEAHGLMSAYEDIQEGMSTPFGIARTSELTFSFGDGYGGKDVFAREARQLSATSMLMPTPEYLHEKEAFGVWSLPDRSNARRERVEQQLDNYIDYYQKQTEQHRWYGFWNYGDVMHAYDAERHEWRYDVGGFAWDNTELASNMWLWYSFLRTGRADIWQMAEAMTRHTSEVDVYHIGPNAMLGSRHNVSHWGCGAKEARISQASWNRFYYYLTTDERTGDLMTAVKDADQMLYTLDPMRLAEPRGKYPCTAPARLRIGPDWLAYAGNWMTEWERTQDTHYRDQILAGMKSIAALPSRMFTGPLALGYDPATGIITTECDPKLQTTNHLMTIMGGFELMNEMMRMVDVPEWADAWLEHAANYKNKAAEIRNNHFRVSRLLAYAAYHQRDTEKAREAWGDLLKALGRDDDTRYRLRKVLPPEVPSAQDEIEMVSTNGVATWALDAIYMQEVIPE